jgi:hypothetical protein
MKIYSFERLDVWEKSKDFTVFIYKVTRRYPKSEKFGLVSQLRRDPPPLSDFWEMDFFFSRGKSFGAGFGRRDGCL